MEDKVIMDVVDTSFDPERYYSDVADFVLAKIVRSPSPQVAFLMADFIHRLAGELFFTKKS